MKLELSENIKKYRKEMNLTQEQLADAFNITVGAVSKWESGNTVPDIMTMMELADFFNISMDVLLGYNLSSKSIDDLSEKIKKLTNSQKYDEAKNEADKALVRYPGSFKIIYACAQLYTVLYAISHEMNNAAREKAIELLEKSISFISQNTDPDISEFSIRFTIARLKSSSNPKGALDDLKKINYMGIADLDIARALMHSGSLAESLDRFTRVLFTFFLHSYEFSTSMAIALVCTDQKKNIREAIELMDWCIGLIDMTTDNNSGYFLKMKSILLTLKGMFLSCIKDYEAMKKSIDQAYALAKKYDESPSNALAAKIKFWHAADDYKPFVHDTLGTNAVDSLNALFTQSPEPVQEKIAKKMDAAEKYWKSIYSRGTLEKSMSEA
ncbi:MAG: helix-turn-helix domain-containing protein [Butyrivibrio sp.]|uniref:helix-turn-helix domain-containing protein n=1 Tax=Butyrivibrio sp. TaxID=28121 RepID=UPI001B1BE89E|nr:helix-turn-helix domain-containing protein [Butyrivibrio sp.]MBO6241143.1 helix-turn-helix domain-containing protein [Butyrivibrio sp.]